MAVILAVLDRYVESGKANGAGLETFKVLPKAVYHIGSL